MKYQHILQKVYHEPWLITPGAHSAIVALVESRILAQEPESKREGENICGEKVELESMEIRNGIARIPIGGVLGRKLTGFEKGMGAVDTIDIEAELDEAEDNPKVKGIILDFDSPGGVVGGIPELYERIERVEKPIFSYTDGMIASAAYWLASATHRIYATRSSEIGSIGVYIPWVDSSERYKAYGYKVKLITSGKYKGMGYPGTSLTDAQEELLKERVMGLAEEFYAAIRAHRIGVADATMQGQMFGAKDAKAANLIDEMVKSYDDVERLL